MNMKIISTQIYDDHEEKQEEQHKDYSLKILDKNILINYNNGDEIIFNSENNIVEIKRDKNEILVKINAEHEFDYETPYCSFVLKTVGEKILVEKSPFKMVIEYKIILNDTISYKNIIEIVEF